MESINDRNVIRDAPDIRSSGAAASAVSWGAIFGGAVAAAALSLVLFILGIGLGLTSVSPWSQEGIDAGTFGIAAILWITFTSLMASGMGGYLSGRLRTRWVAVHSDEVFFRDTAHGFLAWGLATLLTAMLFSTVTMSAVTGAARAGAAVAGGVAQTAVTATTAGVSAEAGMLADSEGSSGGPMAYFLDSLFRRDPGAQQAQAPLQQMPIASPNAEPAAGGQPGAAENAGNAGNAAAGNQQAGGASPSPANASGNAALQRQPLNRLLEEPVPPAAIAEVSRIFGRAIQMGSLEEADLDYVGQLVSRYTNIDGEGAEQRVREAFDSVQAELGELETAAREAADTARVASATVALWLFVALMIGAFVGSYAATWGGRQRDL